MDGKYWVGRMESAILGCGVQLKPEHLDEKQHSRTDVRN